MILWCNLKGDFAHLHGKVNRFDWVEMLIGAMTRVSSNVCLLKVTIDKGVIKIVGSYPEMMQSNSSYWSMLKDMKIQKRKMVMSKFDFNILNWFKFSSLQRSIKIIFILFFSFKSQQSIFKILRVLSVQNHPIMYNILSMLIR